MFYICCTGNLTSSDTDPLDAETQTTEGSGGRSAVVFFEENVKK